MGGTRAQQALQVPLELVWNMGYTWASGGPALSKSHLYWGITCQA